jgi:phosphoadenosine phosphosulfate reductase
MQNVLTTDTANRPSTKILAQIVALQSALESAGSLEARIAAIGTLLGNGVAFSTSLSIEDQAVFHAIAMSGTPVDVFTLDTGRHFPETLDVIAENQLRYPVPIRVIVPDAQATEALVARDGITGFRQSIDARKACCDVRKVVPLRRALAGASGWITGLRREQSQGRGILPFAAYDADLDLIKVNPLADWGLERLQAYALTHKIPVNALHAKGFPSIGCQPCTRAVQPGEDVRAGRWWWEHADGKECGLHRRPTSTTHTAAGTSL